MLNTEDKSVKGEVVNIKDEKFYKISNYNHMEPFFTSVVSSSDLWMFIWTNGGLSAGRKNPDHALFPYYTDDKIRDNAHITGSKTIIIVSRDGKKYLWEPFSDKYEGSYKISCNCYKNIYGNKIIFEEINHDLKLTFQYSWSNSEKYGFIKKSKIINKNNNKVTVELLDGIQNILPYGIQRRFQNEYSTLADGYKKNELETDTGLGIYSLSSIPIDKAEPSEALKATTVWSTGTDVNKILISSRQLDDFRKGHDIEQKTDVRAARGAYFINTNLDLDAGANHDWYIVADIDKDSAQVISLNNRLKTEDNLDIEIEKDIERGTRALVKYVASADGLQKTANTLNTFRHFSNTLFNIMRGGIFDNNYEIHKKDFIKFIRNSNKLVYQNNQNFLSDLPEEINYNDLINKSQKSKDKVLEKLCYEYLPLTFSRRHGDPSRPWNYFSIQVKDEKGNKILNYQGNWRDIFQNWEALAFSFPDFIESMITKFVNASTADGYNPYRVTRDGFDWEKEDPDDPWAYIGYWGDHQIIYLLKLLELSAKYHPQEIQELLTKDIFTYANVPYKIKSYDDIISNPYDTIDFDYELQAKIENRVKEIGNDGKLIFSNSEDIYQVNLSEKLLVPILAKLSNFIPEAGIWMNTQRPEWNDANNALVGFGISMVTLYYLRRHLAFCLDLFSNVDKDTLEISEEVAEWFASLLAIFEKFKDLLKASISDEDRKSILDELEIAANKYRDKIYSQGFSGNKSEIKTNSITKFFKISLAYIDHSIKENRREDGLYHSYNLIDNMENNSLSIRYLYKMLEGQVAVLSSGYLSFEESDKVLANLRDSDLYREDQNTYLLYPDRKLPRFTEKNNIPREELEKSELLKEMLHNNDDRIVKKDSTGGVHFKGTFRNAQVLKQALNEVSNSQDYSSDFVSKESDIILQIYENIFDHQSFTGRSGTFYKYEGLGSTYWHMVSKLLLATGEIYHQAVDQNVDEYYIKKLKSRYYEIKAGIGVSKSPELYGAFPTDAYSHTPSWGGAQQPGLTGQVKEDFLSRFKELGVLVKDGKISFNNSLLKKDEFLPDKDKFTYYNASNQKLSIELDKDNLAFTIAQVPVIYANNTEEKIIVNYKDNETETIIGTTLNKKVSSDILDRTGKIEHIEVLFSDKN
jgi:hypothetical protein